MTDRLVIEGSGLPGVSRITEHPVREHRAHRAGTWEQDANNIESGPPESGRHLPLRLNDDF